MNIITSTIQTKTIAIKLKPAAEQMVKRQHPWIFDNSIIKQNKEGNAGDLVIVYDNKSNTFLACGLYDPYSPIRVKLIHYKKPSTINKEWFQEKIYQAYSKRIPLLDTQTNSYRLLFGENDCFPGFIADVYHHVLVIKLYTQIWFPYLNWIVELLVEYSGCTTVVFRLSRSMQIQGNSYGLEDGQVVYGILDNETVVFKEHGILFSANVVKGHKTGYFLDHRHNRKRVGELSKGKTVLDVFSYAGGFSVHALARGAKKVDSLDISKHALTIAKKNVAMNIPAGEHTIIVADAFKGLETLISEKKKYDIVVIDPPSFAKQQQEIAKAKKRYQQLAALGAQLVEKKGILVLASCSSRVTADYFFTASEKGIKSSGHRYKLIEKTFHDIDHPVTFPEGAYLKCGYYEIW